MHGPAGSFPDRVHASVGRPGPTPQRSVGPVSQLTPTARTTFGRHRERGGHDRELLHAILDAGTICHFGIVVDGAPMVVPTVYGRDGDTVYLHGSVASQSLMAAGDGIDICMTVSLVDGLVLARSVFEHSVNYRSAMVYGRSQLVSDAAEKLVALRAVTDHVCPGQWNYARRPSKKELAATTVIALPLQEASSKVRDSGPGDSDGPDRTGGQAGEANWRWPGRPGEGRRDKRVHGLATRRDWRPTSSSRLQRQRLRPDGRQRRRSWP